MDMLLGGLAFAAIIFGQFAAVVAVHSERKRRESEPAALPHLDHRAMLTWHAKSTDVGDLHATRCKFGLSKSCPPGHCGLLGNAAWSAR
jgi:hypothetical protein